MKILLKVLASVVFLFILSFCFSSFKIVNSTADGDDGWVVPEKYKNMENPYAEDEDDDEIGADLWRTHCKSCHGKKGKGDGTKAGELETELRSFLDESVQAQTDGVLYYKAIIGRDEMPNFEKKIPDVRERWLLINYIRTFAE